VVKRKGVWKLEVKQLPLFYGSWNHDLSWRNRRVWNLVTLLTIISHLT